MKAAKTKTKITPRVIDSSIKAPNNPMLTAKQRRVDWKTCQHQSWSRTAYSAISVFEACTRCGGRRERPATPIERKANKAEINAMFKEAKAVHKLSFEFDRRFRIARSDGSGWEWRWTGYELMKRVERWAEGRQGVHLAHCDDSSFMGSDIVLIEHKTDDHWMGASFYYLPQDGDRNSLFLYPGDARSLMAALAAIKRSEQTCRKQASAKKKKKKASVDG